MEETRIALYRILERKKGVRKKYVCCWLSRKQYLTFCVSTGMAREQLMLLIKLL